MDRWRLRERLTGEEKKKTREGHQQMYRQTNYGGGGANGARLSPGVLVESSDQKHNEIHYCYSAHLRAGPVDNDFS